jgi:hypothetical protein
MFNCGRGASQEIGRSIRTTSRLLGELTHLARILSHGPAVAHIPFRFRSGLKPPSVQSAHCHGGVMRCAAAGYNHLADVCRATALLSRLAGRIA